MQLGFYNLIDNTAKWQAANIYQPCTMSAVNSSGIVLPEISCLTSFRKVFNQKGALLKICNQIC